MQVCVGAETGVGLMHGRHVLLAKGLTAVFSQYANHTGSQSGKVSLPCCTYLFCTSLRTPKLLMSGLKFSFMERFSVSLPAGPVAIKGTGLSGGTVGRADAAVLAEAGMAAEGEAL